MKEVRITLSFDGMENENGHIRLNDFIAELGRFVEIARQAEEVVAGKKERSVYYRIIDLKHSSPATITLESCLKDPKTDIREQILNEIAETMNSLITGKEIKGSEKFYLVESIRNFAEPIGKNLSRLNLSFNQNKIDLDREFKAKANLYVAPEESCKSSFRGMLDVINIHGPARIFWLYPEIGPNRIQCFFPDKLFETAKTGLAKRVEITGMFKYKVNAPYPHEAVVEEMEIFPEDDQLPTFKDILGIAPNITDGLTSEEFIGKMRDES